MGFRNLIHFNKALLAKQIWRLVENPNCLVAQVLKARYYKHSDIMEATIGSNPSYIWRSLMWSRDVLIFGVMWKVGNGKSIHTRKDAWISSLVTGRITSHVSYDSNDRVKELLNSQCRWDTEKLKTLFLPFKVDAIVRVPIQGANQEDARYWKFEKKGSYSVKTGYWNYCNT